MNKLSQMFLMLLCISASNVHAGDESPNNCGKLSILITNTTDNLCKLDAKYLNHGYFTYSSMVPAVLPAHSTGQPFVLSQSFFGPDIDLTYKCGKSQDITIHTQQDACVFSAGYITGKVLSGNNMSAWSETGIGSYFWSQHGSIHWALEAK